jgi:hypothetical protein
VDVDSVALRAGLDGNTQQVKHVCICNTASFALEV